MSLKDLLEKQQGGFIGIDEVVSRLAEDDGVGDKAAAAALYRLIYEEYDSPGWCVSSPLGGTRAANADECSAAWSLLSEFASSGLSYALSRLPFSHDKYGFNQDALSGFLAKHGISFVVDVQEPDRSVSWPHWKYVMSLLPDFSDDEVIAILADVDPTFSRCLGDDESTALSRWGIVVGRAIKSEQLHAVGVEQDADGAFTSWTIKPEDLATWCAMRGLPYPLPGGMSMPTTDVGLRESLVACEREAAGWKAKALALQVTIDRHSDSESEIASLRNQLRDQTEKVGELIRERDELKTDVLAGKSRSKTMTIIGGLAMAGYGMDIHAARLNKIGEISKDFLDLGIAVSEKTLRTHIQEAATLIDRKKSRN